MIDVVPFVVISVIMLVSLGYVAFFMFRERER